MQILCDIDACGMLLVCVHTSTDKMKLRVKRNFSNRLKQEIMLGVTLIDVSNGTYNVISLGCTGGSHLSWIFMEHENLSGLSILFYMKFCKEKFWQKIWAKWESSLTTV